MVAHTAIPPGSFIHNFGPTGQLVQVCDIHRNRFTFPADASNRPVDGWAPQEVGVACNKNDNRGSEEFIRLGKLFAGNEVVIDAIFQLPAGQDITEGDRIIFVGPLLTSFTYEILRVAHDPGAMRSRVIVSTRLVKDPNSS